MKSRFATAALLLAMTAAVAAPAAELPTFEMKGFPISSHQVALVGSNNVEQQAAAPTLTLFGMPASPHQIAVLTPRPTVSAERKERTTDALAVPPAR